MASTARHSLAPAPRPASAGRPRVVIADDCDGTRAVVAQILGAEFDTVAVDNGTSAWERIEHDTGVVALITDIEMPGLDGYELLGRVRASPDERIRKLPVIAITASTEPETRRRAFVSGATGMVTKPLDRLQLMALAQVYIRPQLEGFAAAPAAAPAAAATADGVNFDAPTTTVTPVDVEDTHRLEEAPAPVPVPTENLAFELLSVDAAIDAIHHGHAALLAPYLHRLEQRIQPLLARYRERHPGAGVPD